MEIHIQQNVEPHYVKLDFFLILILILKGLIFTLARYFTETGHHSVKKSVILQNFEKIN